MKDALGRMLVRWRVRAVLSHVSGRLLDIGCGTNALVRAYGGEGCGVDVYQWGGVDLMVEDSACLPFADQAFDTVSIVASLNHIPNREEVLREVYRLLTPTGRLVVTMLTPRLSRTWHFLRKPWDADQKERGMEEGEVYGFTPDAIRRLLADTGFRVLKEERFMLGLNRLTVAGKAGTDPLEPMPALPTKPPDGPAAL